MPMTGGFKQGLVWYRKRYLYIGALEIKGSHLPIQQKDRLFL